MDLGNLIKGVSPEESIGGALPAGSYNVMIDKVEGKDTAAGGKAISLQLRVFGDKYNNAVIFDQVNVAHPTSAQTVEIGKGRIAKLVELLGTAEADNWIGKGVTVYAKVVKQEGYEDRNGVSAYSAYDPKGTNAATPMAAGTGVSQPLKTVSDDIPW